MATVPVDLAAVDACRASAADIADDVQRFIDRHTTVGVERTVARAYGVVGADAEGTPLANKLVDRLHGEGLAGRTLLPGLGWVCSWRTARCCAVLVGACSVVPLAAGCGEKSGKPAGVTHGRASPAQC